MVGVDGTLHMCGKTDGSIPVGHVSTGLDAGCVTSLYVALHAALDRLECRSCWMSRFCRLCAATQVVAGAFIVPTVAECELLREETEQSFREFLLVAAYPGHYSALAQVWETQGEMERDEIVTVSGSVLIE